MKNKVIIESTFEVEKSLLGKDYDFVIGVDEAGRGPLAGPVVAAAVAVRNSKFQISNFKSISNEEKIRNTPSVLRTSPPQRGGE
ncbi:MAG: hypothetical protein ACD_7C00261G0001, partial [uncultured bacterium]